MNWTAVIPFKGTAERKTRLRDRLDGEQRRALTDRLLRQVTQMLEDSPGVGDIALLSDQAPPGWHHRVINDEGRGINAELQRIAAGHSPLLVIHPDLPFIGTPDIAALIAAGGQAPAIAPDRHASGTNALALPDPRSFRFAFGAGSFARHRSAQNHIVVARHGLSFDLDTPCDLDAALALGFRLG